MRVLVTGGSGLVGRALQRSDKTYEYIYLTSGDGDLRDRSVCQALFDTHKPQAVVHLAACVGGLFRNMAQKVRMLEDNARMNLNVVACAHAAGVRVGDIVIHAESEPVNSIKALSRIVQQRSPQGVVRLSLLRGASAPAVTAPLASTARAAQLAEASRLADAAHLMRDSLPVLRSSSAAAGGGLLVGFPRQDWE